MEKALQDRDMVVNGHVEGKGNPLINKSSRSVSHRVAPVTGGY